jgi:Family of unknown function (DUF6932)
VLPALRADGTLPQGIHPAASEEIVTRLGGTPVREHLLARLRSGLDNLRDAGVPWALVNGSFVTDKLAPNDVDGCWEYVPGVDLVTLDPAFLLRSQADRVALKAGYGMDFFIAGVIESGSGQPFTEFFQVGRDGQRKGIVRINLAAERSAVHDSE